MRDLDASAVLEAVVERRRAADRAEAGLLALAVHWVDLHPAYDEHPAATFPTQRNGGLAPRGPSFFSGPRWPGGDAGGGRVRGRGASRRAQALALRGPVVVSEAVSPLPAPAAVGAGPGGAAAGVEGPPGRPGHHPARGRGGVRRTGAWPSPLAEPDPRAAGAVRGPAAFDPDQATAVESRAGHPGVGSTTGSPPRPPCSPPGWNTWTHSTSTAGLRPGRAAGPARRQPGPRRPPRLRVGAAAHPQRALDLASDGHGHRDPSWGRLTGSRGTLNLTPPRPTWPRWVAAAGSRARHRLARAAPGLAQRLSGVTVRPVLDMARSHAVDAHDPPAWMRKVVVLRDRHCVFPGCPSMPSLRPRPHPALRPAGRGGPPGRPPANLACLCRRHHRAQDLRRLALPPPPRPRRDRAASPARPTSGPARHLAPTAPPPPAR